MGIVALGVNLVAFGLLLGVEALISKLGWIPQRSPSVRYMWERNLFRVGDTIGLSIVALAVGVILDQKGFPPLWYFLTVTTAAIILTAVMHHVWLRQSARDSAYPPSGVSLLGILHLPYFAGHVTWVLLGLWYSIDPSILGLAFLGSMGGVIWGTTLLLEVRRNKEG